ncbi:hypothetical protein HS088_TW07G00839 [Tripterygium wilfordii]|uniref:UspA domain-containing protein n=1 Tax=Tripterygium wilfordii TaxID=458696 RepID=A0A7J7DGS6_TRIWF|nr:universal stress protein A-like protein [Tripterygium wilfordii]KAF5745256.1 hypothetical protein HS088_TW07G00839 [Tripterygium wilfordii]
METKREGSEKKVMVVIDENEYSYYALKWVLNNLKESITDSPLVLLAPYSTPNCNNILAAQLSVAGIYSPLSTTLELIISMQERNRKIALGLLEKAKSICATRGVKVETITELGKAKEVICKAVRKNGIDLLVMGDNSNGALKRFFLGSLSNYCLDNANCPVLAVKEPK